MEPGSENNDLEIVAERFHGDYIFRLPGSTDAYIFAKRDDLADIEE